MSGILMIGGGGGGPEEPPIDEFDVAEALQYIEGGDDVLEMLRPEDLRMLGVTLCLGPDVFLITAAKLGLPEEIARKLLGWFHPNGREEFIEMREQAPSEPPTIGGELF